MHSKPSVFKAIVAISVPLLVSFGLIFIFLEFSTFLSLRMAKVLSAALGPGYAIGRVGNTSNHAIRLEDVNVSVGQWPCSAQEIEIKYSLRNILKRQIVLTSVVVKSPRYMRGLPVEIPAQQDFGELFRKKIYPLPSGISLVIHEARVCFKDLAGTVPNFLMQGYDENFNLGFCVDKKKKQFSCQGKVHLSRPVQNNLPQIFKFSLKAEAVGPDLLTDFKVGYGAYTLLFSGVVANFLHAPKFNLQFNSPLMPLVGWKFFNNIELRSGEVSLLGRITGPVTDLNLHTEMIMAAAEAFIDDDVMSLKDFSLRSDYAFKTAQLSVEHFQATVDDSILIEAGGTLKNLSAPEFDVSVKLKEITEEDPTKKRDPFFVTVQGQLNRPLRQARGEVSLVWPGPGLRRYICTFQNVSAELKGEKEDRHIVSLVTDKIQLMVQDFEGEQWQTLQGFDFDRAVFAAGFKGKHTYIDRGEIEGYSGSVRIRGSVYLNRQYSECDLNIDVEHLNFAEINVLYPVNFQISGIFNGMVHITMDNGLVARGFFMAEHFSLKSFQPLEKTAEFLGINSIREIKDAQILTDFHLSREGSEIKRFDFDNDTLRMRSNFQLNKEGWLEGSMAMSLPRDVLAESKIFQKLMAIARQRDEQLDFVVRLSGYLDSLRTELVESELRDALKERLSTGIQQYIQDKINQAIEP